LWAKKVSPFSLWLQNFYFLPSSLSLALSLFMKRALGGIGAAETVNSVAHSGQFAFPGGRSLASAPLVVCGKVLKFTGNAWRCYAAAAAAAEAQTRKPGPHSPPHFSPSLSL